MDFNFKNNLDKPFVLEGIAKLDTYFNYGWTGTEDKNIYASVSVGSLNTEVWDIYFSRESFNELFLKLKDKNTTVRLVCRIPGETFKGGQDRMAQVEYA